LTNNFSAEFARIWKFPGDSMMSNGIAAAICSLILLGAGPAAMAVDIENTPIEISTGTQSSLSDYLHKVKSTRPGAFAVSEDGADSYFYLCEDIQCYETSYGVTAKRGCEGISGKSCVVLFVHHRPRINHTLATQPSSGGRHGSKKARAYDF
jgi:hypothetical protein